MQSPKNQLTPCSQVSDCNDALKQGHDVRPLLNQGLRTQARPRLKSLQGEQKLADALLAEGMISPVCLKTPPSAAGFPGMLCSASQLSSSLTHGSSSTAGSGLEQAGGSSPGRN